MWNFPERIYTLLQYFTGELIPYKITENKKRMFLYEFEEEDVIQLL